MLLQFRRLVFLGVALAAFRSHVAIGRDLPVSYALSALAFAPNAGGQEAYAIRRGDDRHEISVFANRYLRTGTTPLSGIHYALRFPICGRSCFVQTFAQVGAGVSTGGPIIEMLWGFIPTSIPYLPNPRIDFATQIFWNGRRIATWSYPLWLGVSVPL